MILYIVTTSIRVILLYVKIVAYHNTVPTPGTGTKNVPTIPPIAAPAPAAISGLEDTSLSRLMMLAMDVINCNTLGNILLTCWKCHNSLHLYQQANYNNYILSLGEGISRLHLIYSSHLIVSS